MDGGRTKDSLFSGGAVDGGWMEDLNVFINVQCVKKVDFVKTMVAEETSPESVPVGGGHVTQGNN